MITLKQFTGQSISPTDDATLYEYFSGSQSGILYGCAVTHLGSNQLRVASGRGMILGRSFIIEQETILAPLSQSGAQRGRLMVRIDLGNAKKPIELVAQTSATLAEPVQQEINRGGSIFELPLAEFDVDATQVSNLKSVAKKLLPPGSLKTITGTYTGDGTSSRSIVLENTPEWVMVYGISEAFITPTSGGPINIYCAVGGTDGCSKGLFIQEGGFRVLNHSNNPPDGKKVILNQKDKQYAYIAQIGGGVVDNTPMEGDEPPIALKDIAVGTKLKTADGKTFVMVAKNHKNYSANSVCLMSEALGAASQWSSYQIAYYNQSYPDLNAKAFGDTLPEKIKSRLVDTRIKNKSYNFSTDVEETSRKCFIPAVGELIPNFADEAAGVSCYEYFTRAGWQGFGEKVWTRSPAAKTDEYILNADGKSTSKVSVAQDGEPLSNVFIIVLEDAVQCSATANTDGSYTLIG